MVKKRSKTYAMPRHGSGRARRNRDRQRQAELLEICQENAQIEPAPANHNTENDTAQRQTGVVLDLCPMPSMQDEVRGAFANGRKNGHNGNGNGNGHVMHDAKGNVYVFVHKVVMNGTGVNMPAPIPVMEQPKPNGVSNHINDFPEMADRPVQVVKPLPERVKTTAPFGADLAAAMGDEDWLPLIEIKDNSMLDALSGEAESMPETMKYPPINGPLKIIEMPKKPGIIKRAYTFLKRVNEVSPALIYRWMKGKAEWTANNKAAAAKKTGKFIWKNKKEIGLAITVGFAVYNGKSAMHAARDFAYALFGLPPPVTAPAQLQEIPTAPLPNTHEQSAPNLKDNSRNTGKKGNGKRDKAANQRVDEMPAQQPANEADKVSLNTPQGVFTGRKLAHAGRPIMVFEGNFRT